MIAGDENEQAVITRDIVGVRTLALGWELTIDLSWPSVMESSAPTGAGGPSMFRAAYSNQKE